MVSAKCVSRLHIRDNDKSWAWSSRQDSDMCIPYQRHFPDKTWLGHRLSTCYLHFAGVDLTCQFPYRSCSRELGILVGDLDHVGTRLSSLGLGQWDSVKKVCLS